MFRDLDELKAAIKQHKLESLEDKIVALAHPTIYIKNTPAEDETIIPIGASKMGGNPDLPPDFDWPYFGERPMTFIAQFKLSEIASLLPTARASFPTSGMLYFFYEEYEQWFLDKDGGHIAYIADENTDLKRRSHPKKQEEYRDIEALPPHKVSYQQRITLPHIWSDNDAEFGNVFAEDDNKKLFDAYWDMMYDHQVEPGHYIGGFPWLVQNEVEWEVVTRFKKLNYPLDDATKEQFSQKAEQWQFLLQIDTDDSLNILWGDAGTLYVCIPKASLPQRKFDDCQTIFQCY